LRERKEDIRAMVHHFLEYYKTRYKKPGLRITNHTMQSLKQYTWPGNIRELQHAVEKAVILSESNILQSKNLIPEYMTRSSAAGEPVTRTIEDAEKQVILQAIKNCNGNLSNAAKMLQIGRQTLYNKIKKYKI
jgi:two-component system response regulator HydG